jgi:hypothetical protein
VFWRVAEVKSVTESEHLSLAIERIQFSRSYTKRLLEDVPDADWFRMPAEGVTHIAWQVGHLAMAQFALCIARLRPETAADERLIAAEFRRHFGKGSVPDPQPENNPTPAEIRAVLDRVHTQTMAELPTYSSAELAAPALKPHPLFTRKIESLFWCAAHELTHAGQIGLLRRLLGKEPKW